MPIRDYHCNSCSYDWEELRKGQTDPIRCPNCQGEIIQRQLSPPGGFKFKGGGFYETDFKTKPKDKK